MDKKNLLYDPKIARFVQKISLPSSSYNIEEFRDFFENLDVTEWNEKERKRVSVNVARFLADYFKTNNKKFIEAFDVDSVYLRIPSTIYKRNITWEQVNDLIRKLLIFSKRSVISYSMLSCVDSIDGWHLSHDFEFGEFRDNYPSLLKLGDVLFLPSTVWLGTSISGGEKQHIRTVFNIDDLKLFDVDINDADIYGYFVKNRPFRRAGTLSLHFPSTNGLRFEDLVEVRETNRDSFEYFLRHLKSLLDSGREGRSDALRKSVVEVAEAMRLIDSRYKEHRNMLAKISIKAALAGISLAIGLIAKDTLNTFNIMSAIIGSSAVTNLVDYYSGSKLPPSITADPFFVPWSVNRLVK